MRWRGGGGRVGGGGAGRAGVPPPGGRPPRKNGASRIRAGDGAQAGERVAWGFPRRRRVARDGRPMAAALTAGGSIWPGPLPQRRRRGGGGWGREEVSYLPSPLHRGHRRRWRHGCWAVGGGRWSVRRSGTMLGQADSGSALPRARAERPVGPQRSVFPLPSPPPHSWPENVADAVQANGGGHAYQPVATEEIPRRQPVTRGWHHRAGRAERRGAGLPPRRSTTAA
ncbi:hypothetical protein I4F81_002090 [Pyropia yezoensis]|uniref:Uncharacterized protein n=1 Tax=Pyropia yezoensis TaxID=2788 RepID=A0ACC3BNL1_PYRYE|nr:hypothetical protein I4F81_002090 [Neopyropia yezoensis]